MKKVIIATMIMGLLGCSEYSSDMRVTWSTSIQNLEDSNEPWEEREIDKPHRCREGETHYIDPYTKVEYCLPGDLATIRNLDFYRVRKGGDL